MRDADHNNYSNGIKEENQDPDFTDRHHYKGGMKEVSQDPEYADQNHYKNGMKEENQDSDFIDQDQDKDGMKEENQDPDFIEQDQDKNGMKEEKQGHNKNETKEENQYPAFIDQDHDKNGMKEEYQNPDFIDQDQDKSGMKEENPGHYESETKEENRDSDRIDKDHCKTEAREEKQDPDHRSTEPTGSTSLQLATSKAAKRNRVTTDKDLVIASSEDSEDSEYDSAREEMFADGVDEILDQSADGDSDSDWEPDTHPTPSLTDSVRPKRRRYSTPTESEDSTSSTPATGHSHAARGTRGRGRRGRLPRALGPPHTTHADQRWHTGDDEDVEPPPLVFTPVRQSGPQQTTGAARSPLGFFRLFFTDAVLETLLANTNAYGAKKQEGKKEAWRDITINDMFSFIGMVIYMGLVKCSALVDYWKGSRLHSFPLPASVISRNKFLNICRALHISDITADEENDAKRGTPGYDRLVKIKPLYGKIVEACKTHFQPGQHISIDERMVASRARIAIKQSARNRPTKWGYKLFVLTDTSCGYTWNFYVYDSKSSASGKGLSYDTVMSLMDFDGLGTGYHLYVDNFYTSAHLFQDLLAKEIGACGTIRQNRTGFPKTQANDFTRGAPRGSIRWIRDRNLLFVKWMDNREVVMCSTIHKAFSGDTIRRRVKTAGKWVQTDVPFPAAVKDCNQHIGGVDMSDALTGYYSVFHKTRKWYQTIFYHFVDIVVVNAYILHQQCQQGPAMTQKEFRQALVEELADQGSVSKSQPSSTRYTAPPGPDASHKLRYFAEGRNVPKRIASSAGRRNCTLCHRKTPVGCVTCDVPLCFVAQRDCFNTWHTQKGL